MVTPEYVQSLIDTAQRKAREGVLRAMRAEHPCPACRGRGIAADAELTLAGYLDDAADCPACGGTGIGYEDEDPVERPDDPHLAALRAELEAVADDLHWKHCDDTYMGSDYAYRHEDDASDEELIARIRAVAAKL